MTTLEKRMCFVCWITKSTSSPKHAFRILNTYCLLTATVVSRRRLIITLHVHCSFFLRIAVFVSYHMLYAGFVCLSVADFAVLI